MLRLAALALVLAAPRLEARAPGARARLSVWIEEPSRPGPDWNARISRTSERLRSIFGGRLEERTAAPAQGRAYRLFSVRPGGARSVPRAVLQDLFAELRARWGASVRIIVDGEAVDPASRRSRDQAALALRKDRPGLFGFSAAAAGKMLPPEAREGSFYDGGGEDAAPPPVAAGFAPHETSRRGPAWNAASLRPSRRGQPAPPPEPAIQESAPAQPASSISIDLAEARRLARAAVSDATGFAGRCYRGVYEAIAKAYLLTARQLRGIRWRFAYEFAASVNANPELFKSRLRRLPAPEVRRDAQEGRLPVGAIVVYGRAGDALCRRGGPEGGVCGFSYDCGHIEIVTRGHVRGSYARDPIQACSDGCRSVPETGLGSLACIADNAPRGRVNVYVPVGRR
ncbi:MAG: hypothetical protein KGI84_00555 [Elusimicrobia bacterium]|nr:hypothetical protein [Elusimicrobiota bacterium]